MSKTREEVMIRKTLFRVGQIVYGEVKDDPLFFGLITEITKSGRLRIKHLRVIYGEPVKEIYCTRKEVIPGVALNKEPVLCSKGNVSTYRHDGLCDDAVRHITWLPYGSEPVYVWSNDLLN